MLTLSFTFGINQQLKHSKIMLRDEDVILSISHCPSVPYLHTDCNNCRTQHGFSEHGYLTSALLDTVFNDADSALRVHFSSFFTLTKLFHVDGSETFNTAKSLQFSISPAIVSQCLMSAQSSIQSTQSG